MAIFFRLRNTMQSGLPFTIFINNIAIFAIDILARLSFSATRAYCHHNNFSVSRALMIQKSLSTSLLRISTHGFSAVFFAVSFHFYWSKQAKQPHRANCLISKKPDQAKSISLLPLKQQTIKTENIHINCYNINIFSIYPTTDTLLPFRGIF